MDNIDSAKDEAQEVTWQEDENFATLLLRSIFVLLCGALILGSVFQMSFDFLWLTLLYFLFMGAVLPICVIWFFFGQGLRPVEWLSDQKYNAWNYGINFKKGKAQLRWLLPLLVLGAVEIFVLNKTLLYFPSPLHFNEWLVLVPLLWLVEILLIWFVWGFVWFGCAQGFGPVAATAVIFGVVGYAFTQGLDQSSVALTVSAYLLPFVSLCGYICWKQKSWMPILYAMLLLTPLVPWILRF